MCAARPGGRGPRPPFRSHLRQGAPSHARRKPFAPRGQRHRRWGRSPCRASWRARAGSSRWARAREASVRRATPRAWPSAPAPSSTPWGTPRRCWTRTLPTRTPGDSFSCRSTSGTVRDLVAGPGGRPAAHPHRSTPPRPPWPAIRRAATAWNTNEDRHPPPRRPPQGASHALVIVDMSNRLPDPPRVVRKRPSPPTGSKRPTPWCCPRR